MNIEQVSKMTLDHTKDIEALKGSVKTAFNRLDSFDKVADSVHELAKNVAAMTSELRQANIKSSEDLKDIKHGQRRQGERLGQIEMDTKAQAIISEKILKRLEKVENDVDEIQSKGSRRWESIGDGIISKIICLVLGAMAMIVMYQIGI